ncbi:hypothetical protein HPB48_016814 [Haemaphysalis longicornis]|uniref:Uncharacterized protein n=1 Tax=Haemaphysalis longicornis TaxID=44386 RepID=A0A9J6GIZ3_HAELO|nr:hypothetical protein HPB48_016814 [Haemaphysalis longicornis]
MDCAEIEKFGEMFSQFLKQLEDACKQPGLVEDSEQEGSLTPEQKCVLEELRSYFIKTYSTRVRQWAFCYRKEVNLSPNNHIESMHRTLKCTHMHGAAPAAVPLPGGAFFWGVSTVPREGGADRAAGAEPAELRVSPEASFTPSVAGTTASGPTCVEGCGSEQSAERSTRSTCVDLSQCRALGQPSLWDRRGPYR